MRGAVVAGEDYFTKQQSAISRQVITDQMRDSRNSRGNMETNHRVKKPSRGSAAKKQSIFKKRRSGVKELDRLARISAGAAKNLADGKALLYFNLMCITHELNTYVKENSEVSFEFKRADWQDQNLEQEVQMLEVQRSVGVIRGQTATSVTSTGELMELATIEER